jgi:hypothetical protein
MTMAAVTTIAFNMFRPSKVWKIKATQKNKSAMRQFPVINATAQVSKSSAVAWNRQNCRVGQCHSAPLTNGPKVFYSAGCRFESCWDRQFTFCLQCFQ